MALPLVSQYCTDCCAVLLTKENESLFKQAILTLLCTMAGAAEATVSQGVNTGYIDVANTSTAVLAANPDRTFHSYKNMSDIDIVVTLGTPAVLNEPKLLTPGQEWIAPASYKGAVTAIHGGTGTKVLEYIEA